MLNQISELIDTQWDVNISVSATEKLKSAGINRYIVGCKLSSSVGYTNYNSELIDTQWDVNIKKGTLVFGVISELIDTQWDVNKVLMQNYNDCEYMN